jgi:AraC family transcriptional regulator
MKTITLHIRNMCCQRCVEAVTDELQSLGLSLRNVKLGEARYAHSDKILLPQIETALSKRGFVLIKDEEEILVERIKTVTLDLVHHLTEMEKSDFLFSAHLEEQINVPYRTLSKIFSQHKRFTIEKYFILLKVEKTKDMIDNSNIQFSEIAYLMGYKSHQHLSMQFKQITGMTMQEYKKSEKKKRKLIETI